MKEPKPMWNDPTEDPMVREVLDAGRDWSGPAYDHAGGLQQHLQHVAAGTPAPEWARELLQQGAGGAAAGGGGAAAGGGAAGGLATAAWIAVPIVLAGAITATLVWRGAGAGTDEGATSSTQPATPEVQDTAPTAGPAPIAAPLGGRAPIAAPAAGPVQPGEGSPVGDEQAIGAQVEAAVRRAASGGERRVAPRSKPRAKAHGANGAAAKAAVDTDALMQAPVRQAATETDAVPAAGASEGRSVEGPAPAEDLNTKWARGVYADENPAQDAAEDRLEREMRMLKVAQAALRTNPKRALQLARQGEREYGASMFEAERQHVLILALVELGRLDEARRVAKPYLAKYPRGPFSARVRSALATGRVDP